MTVYRQKSKCLRDYLINADEAARTIKVTPARFRVLVDQGLILTGQRKGFFRVGNVIDGYAEAVRLGLVPPPLQCRAELAVAA
jgi:hypothetical protein